MIELQVLPDAPAPGRPITAVEFHLLRFMFGRRVAELVAAGELEVRRDVDGGWCWRLPELADRPVDEQLVAVREILDDGAAGPVAVT